MTHRFHEEEGGCGHDAHRGVGEFLRSLLAGIPWSDRAEAFETLRFAAPRSHVLRIDNANGKTRVIGEERDDVEVRMHKIARAESESAARSLAEATSLTANETDLALDLEIAMPRRWNRRGVVHMEVRVPRDVRVEVSASNGRVCMQALRAGAKARSSNGAVSVEDIEGDVEIHSSNARVHCTCVRGRLLARTSNGKIQVEGHAGALDAATSNGLIEAAIDEVSGPVVLATSNGRIAVSLPAEVDADVDVRVDNGVIRSQRSLSRCTHSSGGRLAGALGRGGVPIKLRTSNGSVSLR
jgi:DUF4097 and DUF4098 domain-containing protein YvlB